MSMLGEQIKELRTLASGLEQFIADYDGFTREEDAMLVTSMDTMREAADTITSLWNSLTASEAALNKAAGNWAKADALIRDMSEAFIHNNCFRWCEAQEPCNLISDGKCQYRERMNELGIYNAQPERLRGEGE